MTLRCLQAPHEDDMKPRLMMWAYPSVRTAERPLTGDANLDPVKDVA